MLTKLAFIVKTVAKNGRITVGFCFMPVRLSPHHTADVWPELVCLTVSEVFMRDVPPF